MAASENSTESGLDEIGFTVSEWNELATLARHHFEAEQEALSSNRSISQRTLVENAEALARKCHDRWADLYWGRNR